MSGWELGKILRSGSSGLHLHFPKDLIESGVFPFKLGETVAYRIVDGKTILIKKIELDLGVKDGIKKGD